eukprot:CAMPEP_0206626750 /NCGR_PEP_ID=MMETSP0325_2-20121206/65483_1 /ASSEMBLY_ACC=CAM_ASM_000347 /TAXON_ID=2866 /ORGANISM="Crypthecodinium cohnii, Strain Seligo" /LENGTH=61 /DNA_ID=CAMNT_0054151117 /DNA_START=224 /DNA_END=405 /DNA_ORIENTATION=-
MAGASSKIVPTAISAEDSTKTLFVSSDSKRCRSMCLSFALTAAIIRLEAEFEFVPSAPGPG